MVVSVAVDPFTYEGHIKKTSAVVNLKGAVDIMVSPLMLEALQRYVCSVLSFTYGIFR
jgi:hypothetical protein